MMKFPFSLKKQKRESSAKRRRKPSENIHKHRRHKGVET